MSHKASKQTSLDPEDSLAFHDGGSDTMRQPRGMKPTTDTMDKTDSRSHNIHRLTIQRMLQHPRSDRSTQNNDTTSDLLLRYGSLGKNLLWRDHLLLPLRGTSHCDNRGTLPVSGRMSTSLSQAILLFL